MDTTMWHQAAEWGTVGRSDSCKYRRMHDLFCRLIDSSKDPTLRSSLQNCSKLASDTDCGLIRPQQLASLPQSGALLEAPIRATSVQCTTPLASLLVQAMMPHFRVALRTASGWRLIRTTGSSCDNNQPTCRKKGHCRRLRFVQQASNARHPPSSELPYSSLLLRPVASFSVAFHSISSLLALPCLSDRATGELMATIRHVRVLD